MELVLFFFLEERKEGGSLLFFFDETDSPVGFYKDGVNLFEINLFNFEPQAFNYLMLADGGSFHVLRQEGSLSI